MDLDLALEWNLSLKLELGFRVGLGVGFKASLQYKSSPQLYATLRYATLLFLSFKGLQDLALPYLTLTYSYSYPSCLT